MFLLKEEIQSQWIDKFNRLRLMQRQGSRLSKIVEGYKLEENYTQDKK